LHAFSHTLADLYQLAEQATPDQFPPGIVRALLPWIHFDGAVIGMGESGNSSQNASQEDLQIVQAYVYDREPTLLDDYAEVSALDPVTATFLQGLDKPLRVDCEALYQEAALAPLQAYTRKHALRHLMLYGDHPTEKNAGRWMVLYRADARPFTEEDADNLHMAWSHISRSIALNRRKLLDQGDPTRAQRASALVNPHGAFEAADANFLALMQVEWPDQPMKNLPAAAHNLLAAGQAYRGKRITITMQPQDSFMLCLAHLATPVSSLTPGEQAVARRFAAGLSNKEIARELGVSPNTVRSQLLRSYSKLGVHDKAALAQRLMSEPWLLSA
jgi:DNA-binding CsgD family transcriptional regulator